MARLKSSEDFNLKGAIIYSAVFSVLIFLLTVLQTTCLSLIGVTPALTFAVVCAIGFILGKKAKSKGYLEGIKLASIIIIIFLN